MAEELDLRGMSGNERLYHLKLVDEFDRAVEARDEKHICRILRLAEFPQVSIDLIIENVRHFGTYYDPTRGPND
jgi:hypothetical protein